MPLSPHGKVDRPALPPPPSRDALTRVAYEAPREGAESAIASAWSEALGLARVGRHDDFFELGGHSLLAVEVAIRLEDELGARVDLALLFEHPTVAALAAALDGGCHAPLAIRRLPGASTAPATSR